MRMRAGIGRLGGELGWESLLVHRRQLRKEECIHRFQLNQQMPLCPNRMEEENESITNLKCSSARMST